MPVMEEEEHNQKFNFKVWGKMLPFLKKFYKRMGAIAGMMAVIACVDIAIPLFISFAVNQFVVPKSTDGMVGFAVAAVLMLVVQAVIVVFFSHTSMTIEMDLSKDLRRAAFTHLQELDLSYFNTTPVGYIMARVMSDTGRISGLVAWGLIDVFWGLAYVFGVFIAMLILNWKLALLVMTIVPIIALITLLFQNRILKVNRKMRKINSRITGAYNEGITGAKTSKTLAIEDQNIGEFSKVTTEMHGVSIHSTMLSAMFIPMILFFGSLATAVVLARGGYLVMENVMGFGILSAFISYAIGLLEPVSQVARIFAELISAQANIERVFALLERKELIVDLPEVIEKYGDSFHPKQENWEQLIGHIQFKNVWFKYPDSDDYILEDFSLDIPAGTTVAIVGETGAGKSTLVNLACRFFEPTQGQIFIDGKDYRERSQLWLHSNLGYVLQNPHLFSGTVMANVRYGNLTATDAQVYEAARLVSADTVVAKLENGYETDVGEGGDRLSTGEKQLISFARAVLANPPIFVLDEATSSIDTETEQLIQNAISNILSGRTSFLIAHRLSTIRRADLILVVKDGKIIEQGTHKELLAIGGYYRALYQRQFASEVQEEIFGTAN